MPPRNSSFCLEGRSISCNKVTQNQNTNLRYHTIAKPSRGRFDDVARALSSPRHWEGNFLTAARAEYATEMQRIHDHLKQREWPLAVLVLPTREAAEAFYVRATGASNSTARQHLEAPDLPVVQAREILGDIGTTFFDLTPIIGQIPSEEAVFHFDGHLTPNSNERIADAAMARFPISCDAGTGRVARSPS
jgi:hypothetical protein